MLSLEILAVGKMKAGPVCDLWAEYSKRIRWPLVVHEIETRSRTEELVKIKDRLINGKNAHTVIIALDERGKALSSRSFADKIGQYESEGCEKIRFVIGGADGLDDAVRSQADFLLALGPQTWPHMLVRVMLAEQIYRAQQILNGHPYHRD